MVIKNLKHTNENDLLSEIIIVNTHKSTFFLNFKDVIMIEADGAYSTIKTTQHSIRASKSIGSILKNMGIYQKFFFRVERSTVINLIHIKEIIKKENQMSDVLMSDGTKIEMPRRISVRILQHFLVNDEELETAEA